MEGRKKGVGYASGWLHSISLQNYGCRSRDLKGGERIGRLLPYNVFGLRSPAIFLSCLEGREKKERRRRGRKGKKERGRELILTSVNVFLGFDASGSREGGKKKGNR